jgi:hypothetical protein
MPSPRTLNTSLFEVERICISTGFDVSKNNPNEVLLDSEITRMKGISL